jgi:malate dehydrogenase
VLVVGNPANTNALIARAHAPGHPGGAFHRDDASGPQPGGLPAREPAGCAGDRGAQADGSGATTPRPSTRPVPRPGERHRRPQLVDQAWVHEVFIPTVGRGAAPSS